jgi:arylsulfatase A-like enzyme
MRNLPTAAVAGTKPTNVVLIVLDTTRRDHLGAYGDTRGLTPYLDKLASEGAVYEQAITPGPWTIPSHASIFTGWFPLSHGCSNEHRLWLDDKFTTLAEMLGEAGYQSLALNSNFYLTRCNLLQGFDKTVFLEGPYDRLGVRRLANLYGAPSEWVDKGSGEAVTSLSNWLGREYDPGKPLFLFVNLFEGHRPYIPPRDERHAQLPPDVSRLEAARFATTFEPIPYHIRGEENESAQRMLKPLYEALIRYQDRRLEEFMGILSQRINLDDTLVIVTADHGENLGEAGRWEHIHAINENLIHVPLVVRQPARFPAGTRVRGLCQTVDILPTVFDVIERDCPVKDLPGRTLVPDTFQPREEAFAQVSPYTMHFPMIQMTLGFEQGLGRFNAHRRVIRTGSMKYIWSSDGRHELFDIKHDPQETQDLMQSKPDVATELDRRLSEWWKKQPAFVPASRDKTRAPEPLTLEAIEQLRSLGYVGGG